jgi:hypothetical protein
MTSFQPAETVTAFTGATSSNRAMMLQGSSCETVQEIIDIAATAEAFAVTLLGEALAASERGELPLNPSRRISMS